MKCSRPGCHAELYPGDRFCGVCGQPVSTRQPGAGGDKDGGLFPLYGVTLGETTVSQLYRLGQRGSMVDKATGSPYTYYVIEGTDFWYGANGVAESMYIARGVHQIPTPWMALGFDWNISYNQWIRLVQQLGYSVRTEEPPRVVKDDGHDSFSAKISAVKPARIPIEIKLNFNYNRGTSPDSQATLYSISVKALKNV